MKNLSSLIVPVLLLLMAETGLQARPGYLKARERTHTVRVDGGLSWVFGSGFDKMEGARANATQPFVGVGALFNFSPRHRVGLDYSYSRMVREQTGALTTLPGGSVEGDVYKDLTTHLNSLSLTVDAVVTQHVQPDGNDSSFRPIQRKVRLRVTFTVQ